MTRQPAGSRIAAMILFAALLLSTAGCAPLLRAGLALAGIDQDEPNPFGAPAGRAAASTRPTAVTSAYQHAPTLDWGAFAIGQPYSVARSAFENRGLFNPGCGLVPAGVSQVLPVAYGAPGVGLADIGPLTVGVAGNPAFAVRELFAGQGLGLAQRALAGASALGSTGGSCGQSLFFFIGLAGSSGVEPVSVLR